MGQRPSKHGSYIVSKEVLGHESLVDLSYPWLVAGLGGLVEL